MEAEQDLRSQISDLVVDGVVDGATFDLKENREPYTLWQEVGEPFKAKPDMRSLDDDWEV